MIFFLSFWSAWYSLELYTQSFTLNPLVVPIKRTLFDISFYVLINISFHLSIFLSFYLSIFLHHTLSIYLSPIYLKSWTNFDARFIFQLFIEIYIFKQFYRWSFHFFCNLFYNIYPSKYILNMQKGNKSLCIGKALRKSTW